MSRLDEIQARLDAATPVAPGHWRLDTNGTPHIVDIRREKPMSLLVIHDEPNGPESARPDAELIANAPADLTALVEVLRAVQEIHRPHPDGGQGYDADGQYVWFDQVCQTCGQYDEYAVPYPCPTAKALDQIGGES